MIFQKTIKMVGTTVILSGMVGHAMAQDEPSKWSGEGLLSAGMTSGNTETTDFSLGANVARDIGFWTLGLQASADYGEFEGAESRNRIFLGSNLDGNINERLFGFGQLSYEKDEFSGYDSRSFVGGGLGYNVMIDPAHSWTVRGGIGVKFDEIADFEPFVDEFGFLVTPPPSEDGFGATASSNYFYQFNDNVSFSNDTMVLYAETSTQINNIVAVTATLTEVLSVRFSYEIRHETDPLDFFEATDTNTRISLVYTIQ